MYIYEKAKDSGIGVVINLVYNTIFLVSISLLNSLFSRQFSSKYAKINTVLNYSVGGLCLL